ncbi:MAG: transcription antitermination factor NusB [Minisyncoccia bacterium]
MANRHLARSIVLQTLFEWDSAQAPCAGVPAILARNVAEFGGDGVDHPFMDHLLDGILAKKEDIDLVIGKAAPEWPIERIATIDRNILRLGLYELLFSDRAQVPAKVAINEAIELAKTFGGDSSGRFVNGVLGAIYKELGEPGKNERGGADKAKREELPIEKMGGAIVYAKHDGQYYFALVHDVFGRWTLSKGHIEGEESLDTGVARIIKEELGLDAKVGNQIGENEYIASHPEKGKVRKHVWFFLAVSDFGPIILKKSGGLDDAKWFRLQDIIDLNFYDDMLPIITVAVQKLLDHSSTHA